ncbi:putative transporter mfs2 [Cytospora mali]|uniref:Transporter mfs2 n=1 Tax=Cytospora mali TaxID=578113 RepID=A0A194W7C0_CYTMA|nr:putative transporter mfs2 [Valsa mali]
MADHTTASVPQEHDQRDNSMSFDEKESARLEPLTSVKTPASRRSQTTTKGGRSRSRASRTAAAAAATSDGSSTYSTDTDPLSPLENALSRPDHDAEYQEAQEDMERIRTGATGTSVWSRPPDFEVTFDTDTGKAGPRHPRDWTMPYRIWVIFCVSYSTWVIILYSTSYTATLPGLMADFHEPSETIVTLGVTTYLLGLAVGSLIVAPMSELFGRRPVYLICLVASTLLIIPCALATSLAEIIVVRFFGAAFGAVMICNGAGTIADISTEDDRALYMSMWSIAPLNGPVTGPLIGGFVYEYLGWRWDNWLVLILTGAAVVLMTTVRETYAPVILKQKAAKHRKDEDDERYWCQYDSKRSTAQLMKVNLSRPFVLSFTEPILWFFNIWISVIYGILYLCFVAYPIVFEQQRGWGPGQTGLSFIGIGIGTMIAICLEPFWRKIINSHPKDPETGRVSPEASASIMSIGAILTPIGQLVFSWTCLPTTIHWAIPIAFGIPFGCGNTLCFIYGSNYLAGAYGYFAASALAGNAVMRSIFGATLPLAGSTMYAALTPQWAGTLLGLMEVVLVPIPIIFYRYGAKIRARSPIIKQMREEQAKMDKKRARLAAKQQRQAAVAAAGEVVVGDDAEGKETGETGVRPGKSTVVMENRDVEKGAE